jgi:hypothetical protein
MSLIYALQRENRTNYLENSLGWEFGKPALDTFIGFAAYVIWLAAATTKSKKPAGWFRKAGGGRIVWRQQS